MRIAVAIIGGGPAGCALALHLDGLGMPIAVFTKAKNAAGYRVPETVPAGIERPPLWLVGGASLRPHYAMASAWGADTLTVRHSVCNALGNGWFLDRAAFDQEMLDAVTGRGIRVVDDRLVRVSEKRSQWILQFASGMEAEADFVVDASGRASAFARRIGVRRWAIDKLVCLSTRAVPDHVPGGEALVEAVETGWWFCAPTPQGELSLSWYTRPELARLRTGVEAALQSTVFTRQRVARLLDGGITARAAHTDRLASLAGERWLAVGDAAFATDPLGSQGLLRGLEWAEKAAQLFTEWPISKFLLLAYEANYVECLRRFLGERQFFYSLERRWLESPFWRSVKATEAAQEGRLRLNSQSR